MASLKSWSGKMKRKIEQILKTNSFFNRLYTLLGSLIVKFIGLFVSKDPKTILFVSYMGKNFNDSPKMIYDSLKADPEFDDYTFIWAFNDINKYKLKHKNTKIVKMDSIEYLLTALKAEYWITNVNIERGLHFKKNYTKSVNTWHGIPLKKVGNDVKGRNDFNFSNTNLFCYSGNYEYSIYKEAFNLTDDNLYKFGMPRNDVVLENDPKIKENIKEKYGIKDKKIILYAPTWRDDPNDLALMDLKQWEATLADEYVLLLKAHGLSEQFNIEENNFIIDVSDFEETSELIVAADVLITDYSSIMFDFALISKPIFLYVPDYEKYSDERGLYFDLMKTDLSVFKDAVSLLEYIQTFDEDKEKEISKKFGQEFNEVNTPDATEKIISLIKEEKL